MVDRGLGHDFRRSRYCRLLDSNKFRSTPQVQFREDVGPMKFLEGGRDQVNCKRELDCVFIRDNLGSTLIGSGTGGQAAGEVGE